MSIYSEMLGKNSEKRRSQCTYMHTKNTNKDKPRVRLHHFRNIQIVIG